MANIGRRRGQCLVVAALVVLAVGLLPPPVASAGLSRVRAQPAALPGDDQYQLNIEFPEGYAPLGRMAQDPVDPILYLDAGQKLVALDVSGGEYGGEYGVEYPIIWEQDFSSQNAFCCISEIDVDPFGLFGYVRSDATIYQVDLATGEVKGKYSGTGSGAVFTAPDSADYLYSRTSSMPGGIEELSARTMTVVGSINLRLSEAVGADPAITSDGQFLISQPYQGKVTKFRLTDMTRLSTVSVSGLTEQGIALNDGLDLRFVYLVEKRPIGCEFVVRRARVSDLSVVGTVTATITTEPCLLEAAGIAAEGDLYLGVDRVRGGTFGNPVVAKFDLVAMSYFGAMIPQVADSTYIERGPRDFAFSDPLVDQGSFMYIPMGSDPGTLIRLSTTACGLTNPTIFPDVPLDQFYAGGASCLFERGITTSYPYQPLGLVTRDQMALFLWRMAGQPATPQFCGFRDEAQIPSWARPAACWLKSEGITTNNPFRPAARVTRVDMAAFMWRWAGSPLPPNTCNLSQDPLPNWAASPVCWMRQIGVTRAVPYRPSDPVSRGEMAAFLHRLGGATGLWFTG
jgi:hypothetical protein